MPRSAWTASTTGAKAQRGKSSTIDAATRSPSTSARSIRWTSSSSTRCWAGCSKLRSANQRPSKGLGAPCSSGEPDSAPHRATASSAVAGGRGGCPAWPGSDAPSGSADAARHSRTALPHSKSKGNPQPPAASGIAGVKHPADSEPSRSSDTTRPASRAPSQQRSSSCGHPAQQTGDHRPWFVAAPCLRIGANAAQPSSRSNDPSRHLGANHLKPPQDKHLA